MYADRFESRRRFDPGSLSVAIAINGAFVAGLIFASPGIVPIKIPKPFEIYRVPETPQPDPQPTPHAKTANPTHATAAPKPDTTEPVVPGPGSGPIFDPGPSSGGSGTLVDPPLPPAPVLTGAEPDPRYARDFQPAYPPASRRAGVEGRLSVRVLIGVDGRVKAIELVGAGDDDLFAATRRQALSKWRFKPATRDGIPYETWRTMGVRFVLNDN